MDRNFDALRVLCLSALLLGGCGQGEPKPVNIAPEDMCALCKMAISEKRFAAEFIDKDGEAFKFDDIACLLQYVKGKRNQAAIAAYFVVDLDSQSWTKAEEAYFVRSAKIKTPMSGGVAAFRTQTKAQEAAAQHQGETLRFNDLLGTPAETGKN